MRLRKSPAHRRRVAAGYSYAYPPTVNFRLPRQAGNLWTLQDTSSPFPPRARKRQRSADRSACLHLPRDLSARDCGISSGRPSVRSHPALGGGLSILDFSASSPSCSPRQARHRTNGLEIPTPAHRVVPSAASHRRPFGSAQLCRCRASQPCSVRAMRYSRDTSTPRDWPKGRSQQHLPLPATGRCSRRYRLHRLHGSSSHDSIPRRFPQRRRRGSIRHASGLSARRKTSSGCGQLRE